MKSAANPPASAKTAITEANTKLADLRRRDLRRLAEVELVEGLDAWQMRVLEPTRDRMPLALVDLGGEQRFQIAQVRVALAHRLLTQFTSFVAVEDRVVNEGGAQRTVTVPVEMPDGVRYEGVFGQDAATNQAPAAPMARFIAMTRPSHGS